jgi:hypothetical protein
MKSWKILRKNLRWCLIMLLCFLVQGLIPPNVIANHDLKFSCNDYYLPRRSIIGFEKSSAVLWIQINISSFQRKQIVGSLHQQSVNSHWIIIHIIIDYFHSTIDSHTQFQHIETAKKVCLIFSKLFLTLCRWFPLH